MKKILFIIVILFCSGCRTLSQLPQPPQNQQPKRIGNITSNPIGADIYYYDNVNAKKLLGKTPAQVTYQSPSLSFMGEGWLFITLSGYEIAYWQFPQEGTIDHNFDLEKDISIQIKESRPPKDKKYLKRVVDITGKCDKVLHSPRMLAASVASEANSEYQKLQIDFFQYKQTLLNKYLSLLVNYCGTLANSEYAIQHPVLITQIQNLISKINLGIGVE